MKKLLLLVLGALLLSASLTHAADKIIIDGFNEWAKGGATAAFTSWAKGGPLDGSKELQAQASQFGQISTYYGKYAGYEVIEEVVIGKNTKVVYAMLNLEFGSLFGRFLMYKKANGEWVSPNFKFHTEPEAIWPSELLQKYVKK
jgi:hypothetical protein